MSETTTTGATAGTTNNTASSGGDARTTQQARRPATGRRERPPRRRKFCKFCADKSLQIDHKDPELLGRFITERFKILPARVTGTCAKHQRRLTTAIKRARQLALLAYTPLHKG